MIRRLAQKIAAAILNAFRSNKVRPFIWLYCVPLWLWGVIGTFLAGPPSYVLPVMGPTVYNLWVWTCLGAPTVAMIGLWLEKEDEDPRQRTKRSEIGIGWQTGGYAGMFGVLLAYQLSAIHEIPWGSGATFTVFIISPYVAGCLLLCAQNAVKLFFPEALQTDDGALS